jgi:hypothetical protein
MARCLNYQDDRAVSSRSESSDFSDRIRQRFWPFFLHIISSLMPWLIHVLSAHGLQFSETDLSISPMVEVIAHGVHQTYLGQTPCSPFHHAVTQHPIWNTILPFEFFDCHTIEFIVHHYRPIGFNRQVGSARVPLESVGVNQPMEVPLTMSFPSATAATLCFQLTPGWTPFPVVAPRRAQNRIYVYATYFPPLPALPPGEETLPVSFKCVAVDTVEHRFSILDETLEWATVGKGCGPRVFLGPTGPTRLAMLSRGKLKRASVSFVVCTWGYSGNVTLHFVLAEVKRHHRPYHTASR